MAELSDDLLGVRDRALLLVGFAGAFRRSELLAVNVDDIEFSTDGLIITIRRLKSDQEGRGRRIGLPFGGLPQTCPVRALRTWMEVGKVADGPVFRSVGRWGRVGQGRLDRSCCCSYGEEVRLCNRPRSLSLLGTLSLNRDLPRVQPGQVSRNGPS